VLEDLAGGADPDRRAQARRCKRRRGDPDHMATARSSATGIGREGLACRLAARGAWLLGPHLRSARHPRPAPDRTTAHFVNGMLGWPAYCTPRPSHNPMIADIRSPARQILSRLGRSAVCKSLRNRLRC